MNIVQALRAGSSIRRPGKTWSVSSGWFTLTKEDLIAEDWETEDTRRIQITMELMHALLIDAGIPIPARMAILSRIEKYIPSNYTEEEGGYNG